METFFTSLLDEDRWYKANDLAMAIGYSNYKKAVTMHVPQKHLKTFATLMSEGIVQSTTTDRNELNTRYINRCGAQHLIMRSRMSDSVNFAKLLGMPINDLKITWPEQEMLILIRETFAGELIYDQFTVGTWNVDVYMPKYKLAIECDEYGHRYYDAEMEKLRQDTITDILNVTWIRYDPFGKSFKATDVLNRIFKHIMRWRKNA